MKLAHKWKWVGQGERFAFGDPDKPYAVDCFVCEACGREVEIRITKDPAPGRCPGSPQRRGGRTGRSSVSPS